MARKILLADDSVTAQNMGRKILTDAGYDVITVNNGSAALKRVNEQKPDLIVLDVYMPGYSGLEVCVRLKDSPETCRIPVLLTVGKLEPFKPEEAGRVRADAFIIKPFEASELLSALTRLEDRMVPQADSGRFSTTVSGIERFSGSDPIARKTDSDQDTGWKSRLRFPSKKKKEEPEPSAEEEIGVTPFRDFKKGAGKAAPTGSFAVTGTPPVAQEPGLVPDIPRDITPEELDALSELVAKLDGPIQAENVAPLGEALAEAGAAAPEIKPAGSPQEEVNAEAAAETPVEIADVPATAAVTESAKPMEAPVLSESAETPAVAPETAPASTPELAPVVESKDVSEPELEIAPVESEPEEEKKTSDAPAAEVVTDAVAEIAAGAQECPPHAEAVAQPEPVEPRAELPEPTDATATASAPLQTQGSEPSPEDLAEALRLLTPSQAAGQTLAEAGAALAEELAKETMSGPRWVAESVALSSEESSMSLEAEMFKSFAGQSTASDATVEPAMSRPVEHEEEEAAEAAVEAAEATDLNSTALSPAASLAEETSAAAASSVESTEISRVSAETAAATSEEPVDEDVAAVTFADAIRSEEPEPITSTAADSSFDSAGGEDDMAKDAKGKSKWHQIHATAEAAAKADLVEVAKQSEETPKAMAAAASDSAGDANAIASIVDSVLADLKPKIVEEIAKKLGKK